MTPASPRVSRSTSRVKKETGLERRFWSKVDRSGECWNWIARIHLGGYGQFSVAGEMQ